MNYDSPENVPAVWRVGDVILNCYEVREKFEGGGMGLVYRVYHRDWDLDLAVKSPRPNLFQTEAQITNFEREAETWVNIGLHAHIVTCYYIRRLGGIPSMFAEFMGAGTLAEWMADGRLYAGTENERLARVLDVSIQIAWGLSYAHEKGLIHQDVKPENILMMPDGTAKITDFGLSNAHRFTCRATTISKNKGQSVWIEGSGFCTPRYASPEQISGNKLTQASDIWSWALVVLALMKGDCSWEDGRVGHAVLSEHYGESVETDPVALLLDRCLQVNIDLRAAKISEAADELIRIYNSFTDHSYSRSNPATQNLEPDALSNKGASYAHLAKFAEADTCFDQALALDSRNRHATFNKFVTLYRTGAATDIDVIKSLISIRDVESSHAIGHLLNELARERGTPEQPDESPESHLNGVYVVVGIEGQFIGANILYSGPEPALLVTTAEGVVTIVDHAGKIIRWIKLADPNDSPGTSTTFERILATSNGRHLVSVMSVRKTMNGGEERLVSHICVHSLIDGLLQSTCASPHDSISCFSLLSDAFVLTGGSNDGIFNVWSVPDLNLVGKLDLSTAAKMENKSNGISFPPILRGLNPAAAYHATRIPNSNLIAILHRGHLRLWEWRAALEEKIASSQWSKFSDADRSSQWNCARVIGTNKSSSEGALAVSSCGTLIAEGAPITIWNQRGESQMILPHSGFAASQVELEFSRDSRFLAARGRRMVRIWDLHNCTVVCTINDWPGWAACSAFCWSNERLTVFAANVRAMDTEQGLAIWSWERPKPGSFLSIARPQSFFERTVKASSYDTAIDSIRLHIDSGRLTLALRELRLLQQMEPGKTREEVSQLERLIDARGKKIMPTGMRLESQIQCQSGDIKSSNLEGTQIINVHNEITYSSI
jgi:serine/threonine protein kinase